MTNKDAYHWAYVGKGVKGADESGRMLVWDSSHENLMPTSYFQVGYYEYCVYCGERMKTIQAGLRKGNKNYNVTGYACDCKNSEKEISIQLKIRELKEEYDKKISDLKQKIPNDNINVLKRLIKNQVNKISGRHDNLSFFAVDPYESE